MVDVNIIFPLGLGVLFFVVYTALGLISLQRDMNALKERIRGLESDIGYYSRALTGALGAQSGLAVKETVLRKKIVELKGRVFTLERRKKEEVDDLATFPLSEDLIYLRLDCIQDQNTGILKRLSDIEKLLSGGSEKIKSDARRK